MMEEQQQLNQSDWELLFPGNSKQAVAYYESEQAAGRLTWRAYELPQLVNGLRAVTFQVEMEATDALREGDEIARQVVVVDAPQARTSLTLKTTHRKFLITEERDGENIVTGSEVDPETETTLKIAFKDPAPGVTYADLRIAQDRTEGAILLGTPEKGEYLIPFPQLYPGAKKNVPLDTAMNVLDKAVGDLKKPTLAVGDKKGLQLTEIVACANLVQGIRTQSPSGQKPNL